MSKIDENRLVASSVAARSPDLPPVEPCQLFSGVDEMTSSCYDTAAQRHSSGNMRYKVQRSQDSVVQSTQIDSTTMLSDTKTNSLSFIAV